MAQRNSSRDLKESHAGGNTSQAMAEPKTPLPPFTALRAFHAAAVKGRFRDAADSLGVRGFHNDHQVRRPRGLPQVLAASTAQALESG